MHASGLIRKQASFSTNRSEGVAPRAFPLCRTASCLTTIDSRLQLRLAVPEGRPRSTSASSPDLTVDRGSVCSGSLLDVLCTSFGAAFDSPLRIFIRLGAPFRRAGEPASCIALLPVIPWKHHAQTFIFALLRDCITTIDLSITIHPSTVSTLCKSLFPVDCF